MIKFIFIDCIIYILIDNKKKKNQSLRVRVYKTYTRFQTVFLIYELSMIAKVLRLEYYIFSIRNSNKTYGNTVVKKKIAYSPSVKYIISTAVHLFISQYIFTMAVVTEIAPFDLKTFFFFNINNIRSLDIFNNALRTARLRSTL